MMEPHRPSERVPGVDFTLSARNITGEVPVMRSRTNSGAVPIINVFRPLFESFYAAERGPVARALRMTLRDPQLADEATDEAMTRAFERWDSVSRLDNPGGWVYRVGLNWARSVLRRTLRKRRQPHELGYTEGPSAQDYALRTAIENLPANRRAVVVCRYYLQWSEAETASALQLRPGTVKSRLHRALQELREQLGPEARDSR